MKKEYVKRSYLSKFLLVFAPFIVGVIIYILFRSRKLFYYQFINFLGLSENIDLLRKEVWKYRKYIPNWVIYSLPDGLWMFSMGMGIMYDRINYWMAEGIYLFIFLLTFIMEFIQDRFGGHGTFLGTYDKDDLLCFAGGFLLSSVICLIFWLIKHHGRRIENIKEIRKKEIKKILIITITFIVLGFFPALTS